MYLQEANAQKGSDFVTKINKTRESVSAISRQLNMSPLSGLDFDEFPQQEDSLQVFKKYYICNTYTFSLLLFFQLL